MKFVSKIYIAVFLSVIISALNAQVSIMLDSEAKSVESSISAGSSQATKNVEAVTPASPNYYSIKTFNERNYFSELTAPDSGRVVYKDLIKLAADPKSNYLHTETNTVFPYRMGEFERKQIISYPKEPGKITAIYNSVKGKSSVVISLTPTWEAREGRLRNEYLQEIKKLSKEEEKGVLPLPTPIKFNGRNYICNGVQGVFEDEKSHSHSQVSVYECGVWLLGIKMKMYSKDSAQLAQLDESLTQRFNPSRLTALSPLNLKSNVGFEREAMKDTVMTSALVSSAFKKLDWATDHVKEKERHSGFPDIYLAMHVASLKEYIKIQGRKKSLYKSPKAAQFYDDINTINNAGFLAEFIMEEYDNVMIVPANLHLNFEAYRQWKQGRVIQSDLKEKKYTIAYRNLPY